MLLALGCDSVFLVRLEAFTKTGSIAACDSLFLGLGCDGNCFLVKLHMLLINDSKGNSV